MKAALYFLTLAVLAVLCGVSADHGQVYTAAAFGVLCVVVTFAYRRSKEEDEEEHEEQSYQEYQEYLAHSRSVTDHAGLLPEHSTEKEAAMMRLAARRKMHTPESRQLDPSLPEISGDLSKFRDWK